MKVGLMLLLILGLYLSLVPATTGAQTKCVKITFEVDSKPVSSNKFKVLINADGQIIESKLTDNGFIVPPEVNTASKLEVRFVAGEYDLLFSALTKHHFDSEWIIGASNPTFKEEPDLPLKKDGKELRLVYYIEFRPKDAEGTKWITRVYR